MDSSDAIVLLAIALEAIGFVAVVSLWRPALGLTQEALSILSTATSSLFAKGPQA